MKQAFCIQVEKIKRFPFLWWGLRIVGIMTNRRWNVLNYTVNVHSWNWKQKIIIYLILLRWVDGRLCRECYVNELAILFYPPSISQLVLLVPQVYHIV